MTFWLNTKKEIDEAISKFLEGIKDWEVLEVSKYILSDGKRFRSTLLLYFTEALGGSIENSIPAALAVEILHSTSLALDDIVDYDLVRRNKPAAWVIFKNKRVIYVTNYLIPKALELISSYDNEALRLSITLWKETAIGALKEFIGKPEEYLQVIELKTGSLFKLSTMLSAFTSGNKSLVKQMLELGKHLGIIYQLVDDYIDIVKYESKEIEELNGTARQLYEFKGSSYKEYLHDIIEKEKLEYTKLIEKLPIREEYERNAYYVPDFLINGLLAEAKIEKL